MWRRLIPLLLLLTLVATVAVACQTQEKAAEPGEQAAQPADKAAQPAAVDAAPAECADNADMRACAVIQPGETIEIGFAGPMTGDNAAFGQDISQAGQIAIEDLGDLDGFKVEAVCRRGD